MNYITSTLIPAGNRGLLGFLRSINTTTIRTHYSRIIASRKSPFAHPAMRPRKWPGGEEHYGFTYYPRYPNQEDPKWEPSPLFMVKRKKAYRGQHWYYKRLLRSLQIEQKSSEVAIVINSPQNNAMLWKIKHLVSITPITFPDGIPTVEDIPRCHLYENGELRISKDLAADPNRLEATETFQKKIDIMDKETLMKYTRQMWLTAYNNVHKF